MSHAIRKAKSILIQKETVELAKSILGRKERAKPVEPVIIQKVTVEPPHESKLMICIEVLCTLVSSGPLNYTKLKNKFEMDESRLKPQLRLLWNRGLIEEEKMGNNETRYVVTERGQKVLKVISPIVREAHKIRVRDFETLLCALSGAGYP